MTGMRNNGDDGDSYAVWRARLIINLRAKRLLSIVTGDNDDDESDEEDNQASARRCQARAAHIMTSALGTGPFLFVQGVTNDPAAILHILDTKYQGTDTSSVMSAVNEFATKKYRPGQYMEMFIAEFEDLSMRVYAIGHDISVPMRVVTFLNSLSEVSALSAVLSALRATDELSWIKATTQILLESDMKGVNNKGREYPERAMVVSTGFAGTFYTCGEAGHRSSDHLDQDRHHNRYPTRHGARGAGNHTGRRHDDRRADHRQGLGGAPHAAGHHERARKEYDQRRNRFADNGNDNAHRARAPPAIGYHRRDRFDRAAYAIAAAHHVGDKIYSQTVVVDSGATRHMFSDLSGFQMLEFIAPTTVKLGDDSTTDCTQICEVVLDVSDGRCIRLPQVLYVLRLSINLLSVSQLAKKGIMTSFIKIGSTLLDTDDGNCLPAEAGITPGGLYVIPNAVHDASFSARALSANDSSSSSQCVKPLSKEMQILWHARLGHVGFKTVRRPAHTGAATGIDLTAHTKRCNCHTCLLQKASRRPFNGTLVKRASFIGDVIHTDLAGPMPPTFSGYKCVQSFIDGHKCLKYI
jgi:gag-polypeptide of LTR copia-type/GAG-pre-integrase domain